MIAEILQHRHNKKIIVKLTGVKGQTNNQNKTNSTFSIKDLKLK